MVKPNLFELWKITPDELAEIIDSNPSMRGLVFGYVAEYKLRKEWFAGKQIERLKKYDDHDRSRPSDLAVVYKGVEITIESKSLQTNSIGKQLDGSHRGRFQCDASDRRTVHLPDGSSVDTTCLLVGQFDLLAVNLFAFENQWRFVFARNHRLPRSRFRGYTEEQRKHLLATLIEVTWPPQPPFVDEPFALMDEIVADKSR